jgi:hypothetical protein
MDRADQMTRWARHLNELAAEADWTGLTRFDRHVAAELPRLRKRGPWSRTEQSAFDALRHAHENVRKRCESEMESLSKRLEVMRSHKAAWMAYAMNERDEN